MIDIKLTKPQSRLVACQEPRAAFIGGVGSGKTYTLAVMAWMLSVQYPSAQGFIGANTYKQLRKATLAGIFKAWEEWGLKKGRDYFYHATDHVISFPDRDATILCGSLEEFDNWRGIEIGWFLGDEAAYYKEEAYDMFVGRLRDKRGPRIMRMFTTPKGFNWLYDRFVDSTVINSTSMENTTLPADYLAALKSQYDPEVYKQEVLGHFVNLNTGAVYRMFDATRHVTDLAERTPGNQLLYFGNDFNVMPMTAIVAELRGDTLCIFDEIWLADASTYDMADQMLARYGGGHEVWPDASGAARKSSSVRTDHQILRDQGFTVKSRKSNPAVRDRYNCINGLLHHDRILIHPRCKRLIKDLQRLTYNNKDDLLGHISDAMGYLAWGKFPLKHKREFREL